MKSTSSSCLGSNMSRAQPLSTTLSRSSLCCRSYPFRPNIPYVRTYVRVRYFPQPKKRKTVVAGSGGGSGGGGGSDGGAYNSSAPGPVRNGLASSREKLCECSLSLYTKNGGGSCPRAYPKAEVSRLGWPLHFARVRKGGSKIYIDDDA